MAKLYFRYGAMGSRKTANLLMVDFNYSERGQKTLVIKPRLENRDGEKVIRSRIGLRKECQFIEDFVLMEDGSLKQYDCILVDEAQFATKAQIKFFTHVVDDLDIPVICYGLRTDFQNNLFEGSLWLLAWADSIEEIKTICWCGKKAVCNARINSSGKMMRDGQQIVLGENDQYIALCRKHYNSGKTSNK